MGAGPSHLKKTSSQADSHYGDEIVVQPLMEALRAALAVVGGFCGKSAEVRGPEVLGEELIIA